MASKNINLQEVIKRDLYNKFGDFLGDIKKKINNDLTEENNILFSQVLLSVYIKYLQIF